ncbi:TetR/AcrR family transcriptional regulator [Salinicola endophyticus]|uniref:TetR/AcrR family transcriptional regulator n=1 Tax=Salinicola endophyticus TaxID=1949083 RepID=A0ABY8FR30_9GAMM|nr:TetR/AcrR family transcriptional regulator [Salinicola endophyticus]WFF42339.1 TetR/AcrR family transcriptional regulator [Salinicola endophyticus]
MPIQARERLIATAEALFYQRGIQAVGISELIDTSGVGRASFYRHFDSKESLVHAVLRHRNERTLAALEAALAGSDGAPLDVFDVVAERYGQTDFRGCAFINAMVEAADRGSETHRIARAHKLAQIEIIARLLEQAGLSPSRELARDFQLLIDGAVMGVLREGNLEPVERAKQIAARLLPL